MEVADLQLIIKRCEDGQVELKHKDRTGVPYCHWAAPDKLNCQYAGGQIPVLKVHNGEEYETKAVYCSKGQQYRGN